MAPFISTHKLKPAQSLNHSSCNRLFRYRLMPHILKCNAFPELAGDGYFSDGRAERGPVPQTPLSKTCCRFLHSFTEEESNSLCSGQHCFLCCEELHFFLHPSYKAGNLGVPFIATFPFLP